MTEKKHYYGLINGTDWGFIDDTDSRVTSDMIELTQEEWQALIDGQAEGQQIVGYGGKCFLAEQDKYYLDENNDWQMRTDEELEQYKAGLERERLDNLTLTRADVERALYQAKGMDFDDLVEFVQENFADAINVKSLKIELNAELFYRKHDYINIIGSILGYSSDDLDYLFENKALPERG